MKGIYVVVLTLLLSNVAYASKAEVKFETSGRGIIFSVVDGDTYWIESTTPESMNVIMRNADFDAWKNIKGNRFKVRLASVDTAESKHPNTTKNTVVGANVSKIVEHLIYKQPVKYHCFNFGKYGRVICNVEIIEGSSSYDLGAVLIENGFSRYVVKWGENPYLHQEYTKLDRKAQKRKR